MGADPVIVNAWRDYAMAEAQASLANSPGYRMTNLMTQMMTQWMQYKQQTMIEDRKTMDKFVPQEGDVMNVMKDFTPQAQTKMMGVIGDMRKQMFSAMQRKDKQAVAKYWGQINSVTDQLKMMNNTLATHKKNYEEGNYSAVSDHFDIAQFTTGKYDVVFDEEAATVSLAMFDRDKNPRLYSPAQLGGTTIVKQHAVADEIDKEIKRKFNESVTLGDFEFDAGHFENLANRLTEQNQNVVSLAHDDLFRNGGKNVMYYLQETEAQKRKNNEAQGLPHIPSNNAWADPWSNQFDVERLKTMVIGKDANGNYSEGGLMDHFKTEYERMVGAYQRKRRASENKQRDPKNTWVVQESNQELNQSEVSLSKEQLAWTADQIENNQSFPYRGEQFSYDPNTKTWTSPGSAEFYPNGMNRAQLIKYMDKNQGSLISSPWFTNLMSKENNEFAT